MTRHKTMLGALALAAAVGVSASAQAATTVSSTFDTGADGWAFGTYQAVGAAQSLTYDAATQSISRQHGFGGWGFVAPLKYLGDKSTYVGGVLSFDLSSVLNDYAGKRPLVVLTGANGQQIFSHWGPAPGAQLQTFDIALNAASFYRGGLTTINGGVSGGAFASIMADLEQIEILGDWGANVDTVRLDNVRLSGVAAVPEPTTWALMILGFGGAGAMLRRRRVLAPA